MEIITNPDEMRRRTLELKLLGKRIGLVPTMGALHTGHMSLVTAINDHCDIVIMSIFVNPSQFGPREDFGKYPRPFEQDCLLAEEYGVDIIFAPEKSAMYPDAFSTNVTVHNVSEGLCGSSRTGHFAGVATVVIKFFNIVQPDCAIFGQKDAQQVVVIKRMVEDLNVPVTVLVAPTVREPDGLAKSSRNAYLSPEERIVVPIIYAGLKKCIDLFSSGERDTLTLKKNIEQIYRTVNVFTVEYIEIVDAETLQPVSSIEGSVLVAVACRTTISNTRLIDNIALGGDLS